MARAALMEAAEVLGPGDVAVAIDVGGTTLRAGALDASFRPDGPPPPMERRPSRDLAGDPVGRLDAVLRAAVPEGARLVGAVIGEVRRRNPRRRQLPEPAGRSVWTSAGSLASGSASPS